ncbi:hypothetical protein LEMLEM_LOCUS7682, partial [Lemmus lemmus]
APFPRHFPSVFLSLLRTVLWQLPVTATIGSIQQGASRMGGPEEARRGPEGPSELQAQGSRPRRRTAVDRLCRLLLRNPLLSSPTDSIGSKGAKKCLLERKGPWNDCGVLSQPQPDLSLFQRGAKP